MDGEVKAFRVRLLALAGVFALTGGALIWASAMATVRTPVGVDEEGQRIGLPVGRSPLLQDSAVAAWVERALVDTFALSHLDLERMDAVMGKWFTPGGKASLRAAVEAAGWRERLTEGRSYMSLVLFHRPVRVVAGPGFEVWQARGRLGFRNARDEAGVVVVATVRVDRQPFWERPDGMAIHEIRLGGWYGGR